MTESLKNLEPFIDILSVLLVSFAFYLPHILSLWETLLLCWLTDHHLTSSKRLILLIQLRIIRRFTSHTKVSPDSARVLLLLLLLLLAVCKWSLLLLNLLSGFFSLWLGLTWPIVILLLWGSWCTGLRSLNKSFWSRRVTSSFFRILLIFTLSLTLENVEKGVSTSHEIWMVGVYMGIFNFNELDDHVCGRS